MRGKSGLYVQFLDSIVLKTCVRAVPTNMLRLTARKLTVYGTNPIGYGTVTLNLRFSI